MHEADELEHLACLGLGLALGFLLVSLALYLVEEWIIAADVADRRRIREVLGEMMLEGAELEGDELEDERRERAQAAAIVSRLTTAAAE
jgi:hypothetical protein